MKKNVALCYSGQIRDMAKCADSQVRHIIKANPDYNFVVFGHFWHDSLLDGQYYWESQPHRGQFKNSNLIEFLQLRPASFLIDQPVEFDTEIKPDKKIGHPVQNILSMFLSIQRCGDVLKSFVSGYGIEFDFVMRMRTDLFFIQDINFDNLKDTGVYVHKNPIHVDYGVKDTLAFGPYNEMLEFFNVFPEINQMVDEGCIVNPECLLGFFLKKRNIVLNRDFNFHNVIYRVGRDV